MKSVNEPYAKRRGQLKYGNPSGDFSKAPRCKSMTRRKTSCQSPAMKNGRCRMHGGCSTGPRTTEGLAKAKCANWKHGYYSEESIREKKKFNTLIGETNKLMEKLMELECLNF